MKENKYIISESELNNYTAEILSGMKPKPILADKQPINDKPVEKQIRKTITKLIKKLNQLDRGICDNITGNPMRDYAMQYDDSVEDAVQSLLKLYKPGERR